MSVEDDIASVRELLADTNPVTGSTVTPTQLAAARAELDALRDGSRTPVRRESQRVKWRLAVAAVAACAALIVGLLVVRSSDSTPATNPVLASYTATTDAGTARAAFEVTIDGNSGKGEGVGNFTTGEASGSATLPAPVGDIDFVSTGRTVYVKIPEFLKGFAGDKPWVELPEADLMQLQNMILGNIGLSAPLNPADILAYIKGVSGEVKEVGHETVRGEDTTRYQARIELAKVAATLGEEAESALSDANLQITLPADIWIDSEGRLRKLTMSLTSPIEVTATFELWDFGTAVEVTPPPADQVGDISAILSGFFNTDD